MGRKLIFAFTNELNGDDAEKYGLEPMRRLGFEVELWLLYPLLGYRQAEDYPGAQVFPTWGELSNAMANAAEEGALLVDFFLGSTALTWPGERFYRLLKRYRLEYVVAVMASVPLTAKAVPGGSGNGPSALGRVLSKLKGRSLKSWQDLLSSRLIYWLRGHTSLYPLPRLFFSLPNDLAQNFCARTGFPFEEVRPIHTMEYDRYLQYQRRNPQGEALAGTCVFLDEALTHHPDYELIHGKAERGGGGDYFEKLTNLFDQIEGQTGLKVQIAAHPRSRYEELGQTFGGREVIKGRTQELVARSSLVLAHASTAISFAALFNKPLLFLWAQGAWPRTRYLPEYLNTELLDLEQAGAVEAFDFQGFLERPLDYDEYISCYLKSEQAPADQTCWELIGPQLGEL